MAISPLPLRYGVPLAPLTTFQVPAKAERFLEVKELNTLQEAMKVPEIWEGRKLILGGGSNVLFTEDQGGTVLHNGIEGKELLRRTNGEVLIRVGGGENWHRFVRYCVEKGYGGVENLSLIPGRVGAAPMQNIGAYGVELEEVFEELEAFDLESGRVERFRKEDCAFGYRSSVFKTFHKDRFMILNVTLRLSLEPEFKISYGSLREELERMEVEELSLDAVSQAVIRIRRSKLPDPEEIGNAGSFFKNPVVDADKFAALQEADPELKGFPLENGNYKIPAARLIERTGWKGKRFDGHGVHDRQPLVLVNHGGAHGSDIRDLAARIRTSVFKQFGVELEPEVNIL
ncbi:MAG: UDP-N-acetylmuramate dehydrogenase [Flavobacteriales bacterium]